MLHTLLYLFEYICESCEEDMLYIPEIRVKPAAYLH